MNRQLLPIFFIILCLSSPIIFGTETIKVGAYDFPPFASWQTGVPNGMVVEQIEILNRSQKKFKFKLVETSANRRYEDLKNKIFDVIFYESIQWGWEKSPVSASKVFLVSGDVFITKKMPKKNQTYFDDLRNKSIRGILGYHYAFANFSTDPQVLKSWNLEFTNSQDGNILAVMEGRSDMAIVSKEFLNLFFKDHPLAKKSLLVSQKMDQIYRFTVIIRNDAPITTQEMNALLDKLKNNQ